MRKKQIPNLLTIIRIILFIPIISLVAAPTGKAYTIDLSAINVVNIDVSIGLVVAGILFLLCTFTDWLDGYLARKWKVISDFGKLWDPVADKILINSLMIAFAALGYVHYSIVIMYITRDTIMDGLRMYALRYDIVIAANIYGKLKTVFQMIACTLTLFCFALKEEAANMTANGLVWYWVGQMFFYWIGLIFSITSFVVYYLKIIKFVKINKVIKAQSNSDKLLS